MLCANCQRDFPLTELLFKSTGLHPKLSMQTHVAQCRSCSSKVPIDHMIEPEIADGGAPF
jgi:DNA-directed RNA polymerase subunit RPC12/RpoP